MEKQTKILLGLGVVAIAAYLILKPKKEAQKVVASNQKPENDRNNGNCPEGFSYVSSLGCMPNTFLNSGKNRPCNCITYPCNC